MGEQGSSVNPKALLVVSFGTAYRETREKNIEKIEGELRDACSDRVFYRAWTSGMIIRKLRERDGEEIFTVPQAMEQMAADGIREILVQPTHVINGVENDLMKEDVLRYRDHFRSIVFGEPLLTSEQDDFEVVEAIGREYAFLEPDEALVLMGHGTSHYANAIYAAMDYTFKERGYGNIFLGTVEAYPSTEALLKLVGRYAPRKVILAPFMVVAGNHAESDMSGEQPESWRSLFEQAGYEVECRMKGLGEYPGIRRIYRRHAEAALASRP